MELPFIFGSALTRKAAAVFCLAMLLVASSVQVMHHCSSLDVGSSSQAEGEGSGSIAPVFCVVCMTVQVATLAVLIIVLALTKARPPAPAVPPTLFPPLAETAFSLYVRPPPAFSS